jgi:hypothetical protein
VTLTEAATTPLPVPISENFLGRVLSTREPVKVHYSTVAMPEDPTIQPGLKRPFTPDKAIYVRTRTDEEPERKQLRGDTFMQPPLPHEGTARARSQADEELGLKQL